LRVFCQTKNCCKEKKKKKISFERAPLTLNEGSRSFSRHLKIKEEINTEFVSAGKFVFVGLGALINQELST